MPIIVPPLEQTPPPQPQNNVFTVNDNLQTLYFDQCVEKTFTLEVAVLEPGIPSFDSPPDPDNLVVAEFALSPSPAFNGVILITGTRISNNVFEFTATSDHLKFPGIFYAEFRINVGNNLRQIIRYNAEIKPNLTHRGQFPLTISEIRLYIRDRNPKDNDLLDQIEFEDSQIAAAVRFTVDEWNARFYDLGATFTYINFPFRWPLIQGVVSELFRMAAAGYQRNSLYYQAGGVTISNKERANEYRQASLLYRREWERFMSKMRSDLNWVGSMGNLGGYWML